MGEFSSNTDWSIALLGVRHVVHLAAKIHTAEEKCLDRLAEFRRVNVEGTARLARQAAAKGVQRFIFVSSIKVNGDFTEINRPFSVDDLPAPKDAYGVSKHEAEQVLREISAETGMEMVIIRPPLVYGPNARANFGLMMRCLALGLPLPLSALSNNRRSLVAIDNLVHLIMTCLTHPAAKNQTFLVSDGEDLSTVDLLRRIGVVLNRPVRLFYVPPVLLKLGAIAINKAAVYQRLCNSLQIDMTKTCQLLDWAPPLSVDEGLRRAVARFSV